MTTDGEWLAIGITAALAASALASVIGEPARWRRAHRDDPDDHHDPREDDKHDRHRDEGDKDQ